MKRRKKKLRFIRAHNLLLSKVTSGNKSHKALVTLFLWYDITFDAPYKKKEVIRISAAKEADIYLPALR